MTKLVLLSDLHGELPSLDDLESADIYVIAGDVCPDFPDRVTRASKQSRWLEDEFREWLMFLPADHVVGIAGNHDFAFEKPFLSSDLPWIYLEDSGEKIMGLNFWGSPWGSYPERHTFGAPDHELRYRASTIPRDTDVLILHEPPSVAAGKWTGDRFINDHLLSINPKLVVCGHIHEAQGVYSFANVIPVVNASLSDYYDEPNNQPISWTL